MNRLDPVIGLEIHVQLKTESKMFCRCPSGHSEPNTNICPICLAMPGALPNVNGKAVELGTLLAQALNCRIKRTSSFDRKHYFYPDLPKGYQITQYYKPLAENGSLVINGKSISIRRIHLEEDAAKLIYNESYVPKDKLYIDFNRCGLPLAEIVTEPDMSSGREAADFARAIHRIIRFLDISDGNMHDGSLRCDANINMRDSESGQGTTITEVKNMNSFKSIDQAIEYEIRMLTKLSDKADLSSNPGKITKNWNEKLRETEISRDKESEEDYRYMPEPNIPPLIIDENFIKKVKSRMKKLPGDYYSKYTIRLKIPNELAEIICKRKDDVDYFESILKKLPDNLASKTALWLTGEYRSQMKKVALDAELISPQTFAKFIKAIEKHKLSTAKSRALFSKLSKGGNLNIALNNILQQAVNSQDVQNFIEQLIANHPEEVEAYRSGKENLINFFIGKVMAEFGSSAEPALIQKILKNRLGNN